MKTTKLRVILILIILVLINQGLRSPIHLSNWYMKQTLWLDGYHRVLFQRAEFDVEILERLPITASVESIANFDNSVQNPTLPPTLSEAIDPKESKSPVVFIPDLSSSIASWSQILSVLPNDRHIIWMEWFGEGDSHWKQSSIVFSDLELVYSTILSDVEEPVVLVGHGLGGWVALKFAEHYPEKVKSVVVINSSGFHPLKPLPQTHEDMQKWAGWLAGKEWLPQFVLSDWLEWYDDGYKRAIQNEAMERQGMPLMPPKDIPLTMVWSGMEKLPQLPEAFAHSTQKNWDTCFHEVGWGCSVQVISLIAEQ